MPNSKVVPFDLKTKVACTDCNLVGLCLPLGLETDDIERLDAIIKRNRPLHRGDHVFHTGDSFRSIYAIKTGVIKTYAQCTDGTEQVLGFHLPGEIIGLDGIDPGKHGCSAKALETAAVCELPFSTLEQLSSQMPGLMHQMFSLMSKEIVKDSNLMALLGRSTAEQRLAAFLLSLSFRFQRRGFSSTDFFLSMSRQEIGSYLGLALETVSRLFTHFQEEAILEVSRKHVRIVDMEKLKELLGNQAPCLSKLNLPSNPVKS